MRHFGLFRKKRDLTGRLRNDGAKEARPASWWMGSRGATQATAHFG